MVNGNIGIWSYWNLIEILFISKLCQSSLSAHSHLCMHLRREHSKMASHVKRRLNLRQIQYLKRGFFLKGKEHLKRNSIIFWILFYFILFYAIQICMVTWCQNKNEYEFTRKSNIISNLTRAKIERERKKSTQVEITMKNESHISFNVDVLSL